MRRLLFNPLAQQPYASGEYDNQNSKFVLDKTLEYGHLYYARIICTSADYQTSCLIDSCNYNGTVYTTPITLIAPNGDYKIFGAYLENNAIFVDEGNATIGTNDNYIIYIYKLM